MERMERKRSISEISATGNGSQVPVSNASGAFVMTDYNADGMPYDSNNSVKDKIDSNASDIGTLSGYVADMSDEIDGIENALDGKANIVRQYIYGDTWSAKTWSGFTGFYGSNVWSDGDNIYYSSGSKQYVLDKSTSTWITKTWSGLSSFNGTDIWSDGTDIYYSFTSFQYVLDKSTSTWTVKTWSGLSSIYGSDIWSDGDNIYYSYGSDHQYVLDKSTSTWNTKTWSDYTNLMGECIWSDGTNIYYSNSSSQYVLNKLTSSWTAKTWSGFTSLNGQYIWSDGTNIYYSNGLSNQYVLDKSTSTWTAKTWSGLTSFNGSFIWSDGTDIYYSYNSDQYVLDKIANGVIIENSIIVKSNGDLQGAAEIYDAANNALSDKYDATSLTFPNERFTITASSWSSTQTGGYYTYTLSTGSTKYNTYSDVTMANVGSTDSTDATSAEKAAYALVNKFDMADGTGVNSFTLYAKTKPTTTFYIKLSGRYMAKNAASSTKALDIETANPLLIGDADGNATRFDGSTYCELVYNNYLKMIPSGNWTSTVDSDGYYTNTLSIIPFNTYNGVDVRLIGSTIDTLPTAAQIAAYNLVDIFYMANGTDVRTLVVKARTKPTTDFYVTLKGSYID